MISIGTATVNRVGRILEADRGFLKIACLKEDEAKWHYVVDMLKGVTKWNFVRDSEDRHLMTIRRRKGRDGKYQVSCSKVDDKRWHFTVEKA